MPKSTTKSEESVRLKYKYGGSPIHGGFLKKKPQNTGNEVMEITVHRDVSTTQCFVPYTST